MVLQLTSPVATEPVEQPAVGLAAAQEDVLAVVDRELAAAEGERRAAEPRPGLEQRDGAPGVGQPQCRRDAGQAAADHGHVLSHGASPPSASAPAGHAHLVAGRQRHPPAHAPGPDPPRSVAAGRDRCRPSPRSTPRCDGRAVGSRARPRSYHPQARAASNRITSASAPSWGPAFRRPGRQLAPEQGEIGAGRYTRPLRRSSRMSRRMLVSCSATPSASASRDASREIALRTRGSNTPSDSRPIEPATQRQ